MSSHIVINSLFIISPSYLIEAVQLSNLTNRPITQSVKLIPTVLPAETRGMSSSIICGTGVSSGVLWEAQLRDT
jgi:hypothetical protein